ncbi:alpha/beta fold hydrolase [Actinomadura miaoliensis]|uniref:AB hydrolase-1 domain-containing protein n=1 Tax=Actinomadura miaoliensis TaxID=430685 RepID=A0ABP7VMQ7_9ACTN
MATFVLVPGYWLGAWAWEEVARDLRAAGHEAITVTLTGLAERADEATPEVDLDTHVNDVLTVLDGRRDVVLVAHSGATMPVTGAADRAPERLARVVYVDSAPLPSGWAQQDFNEPEQQAAIEKQVADEGDGWRIPVPAFDPAEDPQSLEGLSEEHLARMRRRATPQPFRTAAQPLVRPATVPPTPKALIACTFPLDTVRHLVAAGNPAFAMLAGPEWTFHSLPTGHWPMFSRPADLAALLNELRPSAAA